MARVLYAVVGYVVGVYTGNWTIFAAALMGESQAHKERKRRRRAIADFNANLQDRLEMVDITPDAPRTLALGRVRAVEGVRRRWASGEHGEKLTMVISFAGHEIDGFEQWYLDDNLVSLDAQGWVTTAPYITATIQPSSALGVLDGNGAASITLTDWYTQGVAPYAIQAFGSGQSLQQNAVAVSMSGNVATVSGGAPGASVSVGYEKQLITSHVRIRPYLGAPGQNVGAALAAEYPGKITAQDQFAGMALAVVDVLYSPDIFPQGRPNVTAVFRGARCLDPRTGAAAFTENPALHAYHYARWANGWAVPAEEIRTADVVAAANACDASTVFTLRKPVNQVSTVTLPRYRSGIVISSAADPRESMGEIIEAMAGSHGWAGGQWRLRAGAVAAPVFDVQPGWMVQPLDDNGQPTAGPVVRITNGVPREQRINRVGGNCVDPDQRWQILPFPAVKDAVLAAANGEAQLEVEYQAVNHVAHAQHLASITIRQAQAALRLDLQCGLDAWACELFDVGTVNLPRFGFANKLVEVVGWRWHPTQGVSLRLAEISPDIYSPLSELVGRDPAPDSTLRRPWEVPALGAISVTSGTAPEKDGSAITRARITWAPVTAESVRNGGQIEVQYAQALPAGATGALQWATWPEPGSATVATIPGLLAGSYYLFRARAVQQLPLVRGVWSPTVVHQVAQAPQVTLPGLGLNTYRAVAAGLNAKLQNTPPAAVGLYINGVPAYGGGRGYRLVAIRRVDGVITYANHFDTYGDPGAPTSMAAALNVLASDTLVVVWSDDEPQAGRLDNGLDAAMYRCGASRAVYGSPQFKRRAAYVLVGIAGCGEGNGAEAYQGAADDDPLAWCDLSFALANGVLTGVSGTYTARTLADFGYTGDLDATRGAAWAEVTGVNVTTGQMAPGAATAVYVDADSNVVVAGQTGIPYGFSTTVNEILFTADITGDCLVSVSGGGYCVAEPTSSTGASQAFVTCRGSLRIEDGVTAFQRVSVVRYLDAGIPFGTRKDFPVNMTRRVPLVAGRTYRISFDAQKFAAADELVLSTEMRVEVIKR